MGLLLTGARVVTPQGEISPAEVLISGSTISEVADAGKCRRPTDARVVELGGRRVIPGLIDLHAQAGGGSDILDGTDEAFLTIARTHAREGTTSFLATSVAEPARREQPHLRNAARFVERPTGGATALGIHLEGPFVNPEKRGMVQPQSICPPDIDVLKRIEDECEGTLRMMTLAPELAGMGEIVPELTGRGVICSLGHTAATYKEACRGIEWGIRHSTHLFNAMTPVHHREPGAALAVLLDPRCSMQLIADGAHLHPAILRAVTTIAGPGRIALITDSIRSLGLGDGTYSYLGMTYESRDGVGRNKDGTLIGSGVPLIGHLRNMMQLAGVSFPDALAMASSTPARILGLAGRKGTIEPGRDADLAVIDDDFKVSMTVVGGEVVFKE